jgi:hypothetical protein
VVVWGKGNCSFKRGSPRDAISPQYSPEYIIGILLWDEARDSGHVSYSIRDITGVKPIQAIENMRSGMIKEDWDIVFSKSGELRASLGLPKTSGVPYLTGYGVSNLLIRMTQVGDFENSICKYQDALWYWEIIH